MKALVKPSSKPYTNVIPESCWGTWIRNHIETYVSMGWTLIENYEPLTPEPEDL